MLYHPWAKGRIVVDTSGKTVDESLNQLCRAISKQQNTDAASVRPANASKAAWQTKGVKPNMERNARLPHPSKEAIALLPAYKQLSIERVHLVRSQAQAAFAFRKLSEARFIGFDTETKPVFTKDTLANGPHVIQLATLEHAFIVQVGTDAPRDFLREILESTRIVKVGFGLNSDRKPLYRKFGIRLGATVDLANIVKKLGYRQAVGVKAAVAIVLAQMLPKSKRMTTSNWALPELSPKQLQYAANDAHAALVVFHALGCPYSDTDKTGRPN